MAKSTPNSAAVLCFIPLLDHNRPRRSWKRREESLSPHYPFPGSAWGGGNRFGSRCRSIQGLWPGQDNISGSSPGIAFGREPPPDQSRSSFLVSDCFPRRQPFSGPKRRDVFLLIIQTTSLLALRTPSTPDMTQLAAAYRDQLNKWKSVELSPAALIFKRHPQTSKERAKPRLLALFRRCGYRSNKPA